MTSPVDTTVKVFHSGMAGAPVLQPQVGSLVSLLDACLVNGFGSLTLTGIVVSGGVATGSYSGTFPAQPESVVLITGVTGGLTALNGEQKTTAIGSGTFSFATAAADGTAAGTITAKMAPADWAVAFTGTDVRAYRSNDVTSNRYYCRVNDTNAVVARVVGYETMSDIDTGTDRFPTDAQQSGGLFWNKGYSSASTGAINWTVIANGKRFQIWIAWAMSPNYGGSTYKGEMGFVFGDFNSLKSTADAYNTLIMGALDATSADGGLARTHWEPNSPVITVARLHTNAVGARAAQITGFAVAGSFTSGQANSTLGPLTGAAAKLLLVQPMICIDRATHGPRGYLKELFHVPQGVPSGTVGLDKGDLVIGTGPASGRKLMVVPGSGFPAEISNGTYKAVTLVDVTGPWD